MLDFLKKLKKIDNKREFLNFYIQTLKLYIPIIIILIHFKIDPYEIAQI